MLIAFFVCLVITLAQTSTAMNLTEEEQTFLADHPVVVVGGERDWPPMDYVEDGVYKGATKDYLDEIAAITGIQFNIVSDYSWSELMVLLRSREIDMVPMMYWTELTVITVVIAPQLVEKESPAPDDTLAFAG